MYHLKISNESDKYICIGCWEEVIRSNGRHTCAINSTKEFVWTEIRELKNKLKTKGYSNEQIKDFIKRIGVEMSN